MAEVLHADAIDWSEYERNTECRAKVRTASDWAAELAAQFETSKRVTSPSMFSTRLRGLIEFRPGEVTAWAGYNGHRKSMLTTQLTLDLCVQRERVLILSPEMPPESTLARMARQASASDRPSADWLSAFSQWTDGRLWLFDHMGRVTPSLVIAVIRYFAAELAGSHVVIDSMMMVVGSEEHLDEQKQFVTDIVRVAQEVGVHIHLVAHCRKPAGSDGELKPPSKYDLRGSAAISDQCPNVCLVWANKGKVAALEKDPHDEAAKAQPDALVIVDKQRHGQWEGKVKLWFDERTLRFVDDRTSQIEPYRMVTST